MALNIQRPRAYVEPVSVRLHIKTLILRYKMKILPLISDGFVRQVVATSAPAAAAPAAAPAAAAGVPTSVLQLSEMITAAELTDAEAVEEIIEDVTGKYC